MFFLCHLISIFTSISSTASIRFHSSKTLAHIHKINADYAIRVNEKTSTRSLGGVAERHRTAVCYPPHRNRKIKQKGVCNFGLVE
ncbi:hypothetical protein DM02DRAFT_377667 [Periconia macrospinosa]|uniref:Secreted protein n=1 Tax=Periconia macrospinosa TaxID=97972 RepID=A0A2V1EBX7_9PLEO|nr:hypothetical protein DM02DRAFT_377667 [Periconia macrospinosa]